jgi:hypothetical protein
MLRDVRLVTTELLKATGYVYIGVSLVLLGVHEASTVVVWAQNRWRQP